MPQTEERYLYLAGAFAAGGWFTDLGPGGNVNVALPTVAPVHLPMVGGFSEASASNVVLDGAKVNFGRQPKAELATWRARTFFTLASGYSLTESTPDLRGPRAWSRTKSEIKSLRVDGLFLKYGLLNLETTQKLADPYPDIKFGETEISGLKLDSFPLTVTIDTTLFNRYSTLAKFEEAFNAGKMPRALSRTLLKDEPSGRLHRNQSGYVVGSIVKSIQGTLPEGAFIEPDGYTICWPAFGRIVLGEVTMGPYIRRATLVRIEHCELECGSGCSGGSYYP